MPKARGDRRTLGVCVSTTGKLGVHQLAEPFRQATNGCGCALNDEVEAFKSRPPVISVHQLPSLQHVSLARATAHGQGQLRYATRTSNTGATNNAKQRTVDVALRLGQRARWWCPAAALCACYPPDAGTGYVARGDRAHCSCDLQCQKKDIKSD